MRKVFGLISGVFSPLFFATAAFGAGEIPITPPAGSIGNICITKVPQFLIQLLFVLGIIIAIVFLIFGGIRWVISGGDKTAVENARNTIVAAIIGLIIIVGAFFIIGLIFQILGQPNPITNLVLTNIAGTAIVCP